MGFNGSYLKGTYLNINEFCAYLNRFCNSIEGKKTILDYTGSLEVKFQWLYEYFPKNRVVRLTWQSIVRKF